jgi:hypothetical protein
MNKKPLLLSLAILMLITLSATHLARSANTEEQPQTAIRILPAQTKNLAIGDSFTLNVSAENCVDVYAIQVDIRYDSTVLELDNISPASTFSFPFIIRNESNIFSEDLNITYNGDPYGQIYYVASRSGDVPGINGGALLFTVTFTVISNGSSAIQLIQYHPSEFNGAGTYFMTPQNPPQFTNVFPEFYSATYGEPTSSPTSPASSTSDNNAQVLSAASLPYLAPFAFAALFLIVIRRKMTGKKSNQ